MSDRRLSSVEDNLFIPSNEGHKLSTIANNSVSSPLKQKKSLPIISTINKNDKKNRSTSCHEVKYSTTTKTYDNPSVLKSMFYKYDREGKGYLTKTQFALLLSKLSGYIQELKGVEYNEAIATFELFDKNSDNRLTFDEFCEWWSMKPSNRYSYFCGEKSKLLKKAYALYTKYASDDDTSNIHKNEDITKINSGLTYTQFERMMTDLNIPHSEFDFDNLDTSDNGILSFSEFCNWLNWF